MIDLIKLKVQKQILEIGEILNSIGERVEGNLICDVSSSNFTDEANRAKIFNLMRLAQDSERVCEIGVNAGHSLLLMVSSNPSAEYTVFDLGAHGYTRPCVEYIKQQYPDTHIREFYGDTKITLPEHIAYNLPYEFDFIHVDGGHDTHTVVNDFNYSRLLLFPHGVVAFDDYNYSNIKEVLDYYLKQDVIVEHWDNLMKTNLHLVYKFK